MENQFIKRIKSLLWRACAVAVVAFVNYIVVGISGIGAPEWLVILIGLSGGEVTKYLNRAYQLGKSKE